MITYLIINIICIYLFPWYPGQYNISIISILSNIPETGVQKQMLPIEEVMVLLVHLLITFVQGKRLWHLCYHSTKYPFTTYTHMDVDSQCQNIEGCLKQSCFVAPNANSTLRSDMANVSTQSLRDATNSSIPVYAALSSISVGEPDEDVGHMSHIPRRPPTPATYTIPSMNKITEEHTEDLFGMIKLKDNDVCYTSGSIEWVGRKRCFPINSGFKIINEGARLVNEPSLKRVRRLDKTFTLGPDNKIKECDCANVLPTVNAIVDHLNALHEAVDLVDLRLNNLEDVIDKK